MADLNLRFDGQTIQVSLSINPAPSFIAKPDSEINNYFLENTGERFLVMPSDSDRDLNIKQPVPLVLPQLRG